MAVSDGRIINGADIKAMLGETTSDNDTIITLSIRRAEGAIRRYLKYDPVIASRTEFYPQSQGHERSVDSLLEATATQAIFTQPSGSAGNELQLQHVPVRASTAMALYVDYGAKAGTKTGAFASDTQKTEGEDYWPNYDGVDSSSYSFCKDGIIRSHGLWPTEPGSIKIVYTAGYTLAELQGRDSVLDASPIWDAAIEECVQRAKKAILNKKSATLGYLAGPLTHERLGDYDYQVSTELAVKMFGIKPYDLLPESISKLEEFVNYGYAINS